MYHSITFGDKNTWDDWHLIPASRPVFAPPQVKTNTVEIPGGDGALDLTEALAGRPLYQNRTGSFTFYVQNGYKDWTALYSEIMAYLHGQYMRAVLEDDPAYFYEGRFSVNEWTSDKDYSSIVINYDVGPYKKNTNSTGTNWLWDTFNFETGIIRNYKDLPIDNTSEDPFVISCYSEEMEVIPTITVTADGMSVRFKDETYSLSKGVNRIEEIVFQNGENELAFIGTGRVTIEFTGGRL